MLFEMTPADLMSGCLAIVAVANAIIWVLDIVICGMKD